MAFLCCPIKEKNWLCLFSATRQVMEVTNKDRNAEVPTPVFLLPFSSTRGTCSLLVFIITSHGFWRFIIFLEIHLILLKLVDKVWFDFWFWYKLWHTNKRADFTSRPFKTDTRIAKGKDLDLTYHWKSLSKPT